MTWSSFMPMGLPLEDARWESALHTLGCAALAIVSEAHHASAPATSTCSPSFTAPYCAVMSAGCAHGDVGRCGQLGRGGAGPAGSGARARLNPSPSPGVPMHVDAQGVYYSYVNAVRVNGLWWVPL